MLVTRSKSQKPKVDYADTRYTLGLWCELWNIYSVIVHLRSPVAPSNCSVDGAYTVYRLDIQRRATLINCSPTVDTPE